MSVEALSWVLNQAPRTSPPQRLVLIALANHADPSLRAAFPSIGRIARYTCLSERTIRYALRSLEELGLIEPCDPAIIAAHIGRPDRRPQGWNLRPQPVDKAGDAPEDGGQELPPAPRTGGNRRPNGGQETTERGAPVAPEPSLTTPEPSSSEEEDDSAPTDPYAAALLDELRASWPTCPEWVCSTAPALLLSGWTPAAAAAAVDEYGALRDARNLGAVIRSRLRDIAARTPTDPAPARPDWCGRCDETTRLVAVTDTVVSRCRVCHPLAPAGAL
jgi:hypothetical protein